MEDCSENSKSRPNPYPFRSICIIEKRNITLIVTTYTYIITYKFILASVNESFIRFVENKDRSYSAHFGRNADENDAF